MKENLLQDFIRLVSLHTGLCVRDQERATFGRKIAGRMKSLSIAERDYFALLEGNGPAGEKEWSELAVLLTTLTNRERDIGFTWLKIKCSTNGKSSIALSSTRRSLWNSLEITMKRSGITLVAALPVASFLLDEDGKHDHA